MAEHRVFVKRLHDIVVRAQREGILRHLFAARGAYHDKAGCLLDSGVLPDPVQHAKAIHLRHDDIQKNHIRLLIPNQLVSLLPILCHADHVQILI